MANIKTMCGIYCAVSSAIGAYFYLVIAIMEFRQNQALKYDWNISKELVADKIKEHDVTGTQINND